MLFIQEAWGYFIWPIVGSNGPGIATYGNESFGFGKLTGPK
jgi:hypothetical protein